MACAPLAACGKVAGAASSTPPTATLKPQVTVTIELVKVECRNTEDITGGDELYLIGSLVPLERAEQREFVAQAVLTTPLEINDGQTQSFHASERTLFHGQVEQTATIRGGLKAYDEDVSHDWANRPKWVDEIAAKVVTGVTNAAIKSENALVITGAAILDLAIAGWYIGADTLDRDDDLGSLQFEISAVGPEQEDLEWSFSRQGIISSWDYTIHYRISRAYSG